MLEIFTVLATAGARLAAAWIAFRLYRGYRQKRFAIVAAVLLISSGFPAIDLPAASALTIYLTPLGRALAVLLTALVLVRTLDELTRRTQELREMRDALEVRVADRTAELRRSEESLRRQNKEVRRLAGQLISTQEDERRRLARELHDHFSQSLAAVAIEIAHARRQAESGGAGLGDRLERAETKVLQFADEVHDLSRLLHPAIIDDLGLVAAIRAECRAFSDREEIEVQFDSVDVPDDIGSDAKLTLYRITQEALRNIAKHADAEKAQVNLAANRQGVHLTIHDSGQGFDMQADEGRIGLGLVSMAERVHLLEGDVDVRSEPGAGTSIEVVIPLDESAQNPSEKEEEAAVCAQQ